MTIIDATKNFEDYRASIAEVNQWYKKNGKNQMNEADTRFHLIDEIFIKCLGWDKDDVKNEEPQNTEYADYTFYSNSRRCLILEAKRESIGFELPAGFDKRSEYKISSLMKDNEGIGSAIKQVIGYCNQRGVEIAAVSNGYQIVAFLAHRNDGINPIDGKALVFNSLDRMEADFFTLWQVLSKPAILQKKIVLQLQSEEYPLLPLKLSAVTDNYPRVARRNEMQADLQIVGEVILESVNRNEEVIDSFLTETYCTSGALSQYALVSKAILNNRYSLLFEDSAKGPIVKEAVTRKGISSEVFAESLSSRPILLLGDVGAGKSMFINYFIRIEANEVIKKSFTIYIDLGSKAALDENLKQFFLGTNIQVYTNPLCLMRFAG